MPLITWGGDMITIHANGDSRTTKPGSLFAKAGLNVRLKREDNFLNQVKSYLRCDTPYLRGTQGQLNLAAAVTEKDPRTKMVLIFQHTWSAGGDALVVKDNIRSTKDLKGKTIALQAYGPHVAYLFKLLADAGLSPSDVNLKFTKDIAGFTGDSTPGVAMLEDKSVDAAMVIIPDAEDLTSGGTTGTGAGNSVKGARILLSTKSASRIISDVYAVRSDYFEAHKDEVQKFTHALLASEEEMVVAARNKTPAFKATAKASADILLDEPTNVSSAEGLWKDAETTGINGNVKFFTDSNYPRNVDRINKEIQAAYVKLGLLPAKMAIAQANWDYRVLAEGLKTAGKMPAPHFNAAKVAKVITEKAASGTLNDGTLLSFEINFKPNQKDFPVALYQDAFKKAIDLAATYAGAVITVEGHSDPYNYQKAERKGEGEGILSRIKQASRSLSINRALAVRNAIIDMANKEGVTLDKSQFVAVGLGIAEPKIAKMPTTREEWVRITAANRRVVFKLVNVEAESSQFESFGN